MSDYLLHRRNLKIEGKPDPVKKVYRIPKRSKTRIKEQKVYVEIVKEMLAEDPYCELRVPGICTGLAEGLDHTKKRGKYFLDREYLKRACNACNGWKETHPKEAIEMGISISKYSPK